MGRFLRDDPELAFDTLHCLSAVDYLKEDRIEIVYHLTSLKHRHWIVLKVFLPRTEPRMSTVEKVWPMANWHEREAYDISAWSSPATATSGASCFPRTGRAIRCEKTGCGPTSGTASR